MKTKRLPPEARETLLIDTVLKLAAKHGLANLTRDQIADAASVSPGLVSARLGTMVAMRRTVMRQAVARGDVKVVAQGIAMRDPHALKAPPELRQKAADLMRA